MQAQNVALFGERDRVCHLQRQRRLAAEGSSVSNLDGCVDGYQVFERDSAGDLLPFCAGAFQVLRGLGIAPARVG